jgi:NADPH-dependent ferric siderophore reductase
MASITARLRDTIAQLVFKECALDEVQDLSPRFRRFRISGESLRDKACAPGDKLQVVMMPEAFPRTFTPFAHDAGSASLSLLVYMHGDEPAARWARTAERGAKLRAFGPRGSLSLAALDGPVVFFGDETSLGTAVSLRAARGQGNGLSFVFECTDPAEVERVASELQLTASALVARKPGAAHIAALGQQLRAALAATPNAHLVLTGHAQTIQALRANLRATPAPHRSQKVKPYWADGKKGLD